MLSVCALLLTTPSSLISQALGMVVHCHPLSLVGVLRQLSGGAVWALHSSSNANHTSSLLARLLRPGAPGRSANQLQPPCTALRPRR
jgi:hypothetical protein